MSASETQQVAQSRLGKRPVELPSEVKFECIDGRIRLKGPKGEFDRALSSLVRVKQDGQQLIVEPVEGTGKKGKQFQGLSRALLQNMVEGVHKGYTRAIDLHGVGYRAELSGKTLTMALGLSHSVKHDLPDGIKARVEVIDTGGLKRPRVHLESHDKELLGRIVSRLRSYRPPEPYKGKGIRIVGERIREKVGKAGGKK